MTYVYIGLSVVAVLAGLSFLSIILNRPKPKFRSGQLISILHPEVHVGRYMLVEDRRWVKVSTGTTGPHKQWVYDGHILTGNPGGEILRVTGGMCFLESHLGYARGFEY